MFVGQLKVMSRPLFSSQWVCWSKKHRRLAYFTGGKIETKRCKVVIGFLPPPNTSTCSRFSSRSACCFLQMKRRSREKRIVPTTFKTLPTPNWIYKLTTVLFTQVNTDDVFSAILATSEVFSTKPWTIKLAGVKLLYYLTLWHTLENTFYYYKHMPMEVRVRCKYIKYLQKPKGSHY